MVLADYNIAFDTSQEIKLASNTEAIVKNLKPVVLKRIVRTIKLDKEFKNWKD
tara:strand:+ start:52 stop:210 length:159 start_codon:yes stop_codon:yes gene_type:complete